MAIIDTVLDAQNETTDQFRASDVAFRSDPFAIVQARRDSGNTAVTLGVEVSVDRTTRRWTEVDELSIATGAGSTDHYALRLADGCAYRVRYKTNSTNDIGVFVSGRENHTV